MPGSPAQHAGLHRTSERPDLNDIISFVIQQNQSGPAGWTRSRWARHNVVWVTIWFVLLLVSPGSLSRYNMRLISLLSFLP